MRLNDLSNIIIVALVRNKLRTILAVLGIVVAIAAVVIVRSIGEGASKMMEKEISSMGENLLVILPEKKRKGAAHSGLGSSMSLTINDCESIQKELGHIVSSISPAINGTCQVIKGNLNWNVQVSGVSAEYERIRCWNVFAGSFFSETDVSRRHKVCVLGETVRRKLFHNDEDVIGSVIRIERVPFRIIGLLSPKGSNAMGHDQDDLILIPHTVVTSYLGRSHLSSINAIYLSLYSIADIEKSKMEITSLLRQRHNLLNNVEDDFLFRDTIEIMKTRGAVTSLASLMLSILAGIALLVGGIGIMNVMLVAVTERIKEIGLRMSIGASPMDILLQFLFESFVLSVSGGGIGVILGIGISHLIAKTLQWPIMISSGNIISSVLISSAVGVVFGFLPAYKASRMSPIDCLRTE